MSKERQARGRSHLVSRYPRIMSDQALTRNKNAGQLQQTSACFFGGLESTGISLI